MSTRDPILRLVGLVIENYDDWVLVAEAMEPKRPGSIATLPIACGDEQGSDPGFDSAILPRTPVLPNGR